MAERDRTNLFLSFRSTYSHHPRKRPRFAGPSFGGAATSSDRVGLLSGAADDDDVLSDSGDAVIEMDRLPPRWADVSDEVSDILADIARKSAKLDRLHQKHVLPGFDDGNRGAEEGEIERLTTEITAGFHRAQDRIRRVDGMLRGAGRAEEAMGRNVQVSLAGRVQDASTTFRKKQSAYLKKLRGLSGLTTPLDRAASPYAGSSSNTYDTAAADPSADVSFSQSALQQSASLTSNDAAIMQREREITDIAKGIIELADIFKELQTMVIDQGTLLDRIDYNVEKMSTNLREADKEMTTASTYQRKTTKRKIIFLLLLIILGMVLVLILKPLRRHHSGGGIDRPPPVHRPDGTEQESGVGMPIDVRALVAGRAVERGIDGRAAGAGPPVRLRRGIEGWSVR